jgi:hypothetical protein
LGLAKAGGDPALLTGIPLLVIPGAHSLIPDYGQFIIIPVQDLLAHLLMANEVKRIEAPSSYHP